MGAARGRQEGGPGCVPRANLLNQSARSPENELKKPEFGCLCSWAPAIGWTRNGV